MSRNRSIIVIFKYVIYIYCFRSENRNCSELIKNTIYTLLVLQQRNNNKEEIVVHESNDRKNKLKRTQSLININYYYKCIKCGLEFVSTSTTECIQCFNEVKMMDITDSPCKYCSLSSLEPPNYRNYDILNYERCKCQKKSTNLLTLANIKSYSCSIAPTASQIDGERPKNIRTTASGINESSSNYLWTVKSGLPNGTWTCKRCTLLNSANFVVCEACETPYSPDLNSNISPSVFIKVSNEFQI